MAEIKVVQPGDRRVITFAIKLAHLNYSLAAVTDLTVRRFGPDDEIVDLTLADVPLLLEVVAGTGGVLKINPDNAYWPDVEGLYRFSCLIVEPSDPTKVWVIPSDPRDNPEIQVLKPERMV